MHAGLHVIRWGLSRGAIVVGVTVLAAIVAYIGLVFVLVAIQAVSALGQ